MTKREKIIIAIVVVLIFSALVIAINLWGGL